MELASFNLRWLEVLVILYQETILHTLSCLCSLYEQRDVNLDSRPFPVKSRLPGFWKRRLLRLPYKPE